MAKLKYGDLGDNCQEGVMFSTYQTLIAKNRSKQTRMDQLVDWCGGDEFDGLIMLDEVSFVACHKSCLNIYVHDCLTISLSF